MTDEEYIRFLEDYIIEERNRNRRWFYGVMFILFICMVIVYVRYLFPRAGDGWIPQELSQWLNTSIRS